MACLVFLAAFTVFTTIAIELENEWGVSNEALNNGTNATGLISQFNIWNGEEQKAINASQYSPGGSSAQTPDISQSATVTTTSSFIMAIKFAGQALTLPKKIIILMGEFLGIDSVFLNTLIVGITITIVFILASAAFYNKL
jgi:hypothetical protein